MNLYKAFIFDFDYTLGDSTKGIELSVNYALSKLGYRKMDREEIKKTIGLSLKDTFTTLVPDAKKEDAEQFVTLFRQKADEVMVDNTELYSCTEAVLRSMKAKGYRVGIVTTKFRYRIEAILDKFAMGDVVDIVVGGEDVKVEKPAPEGLLLAIDRLKLEKQAVLYVGDSLVDGETAKRATVDFASVLTGTTKPEELESFPSIGIFENVGEVWKFVSGV